MKLTIEKLKRLIQKSLKESKYIASDMGVVKKDPTAKFYDEDHEERLKDIVRRMNDLKPQAPRGFNLSDPEDKKKYKEYMAYQNPLDPEYVDPASIKQAEEIYSGLHSGEVVRPSDKEKKKYDTMASKQAYFDMLPPPIRSIIFDKEYDVATQIFNFIASAEDDEISSSGGKIGTGRDYLIDTAYDAFSEEERKFVFDAINQLYSAAVPGSELEEQADYADEFLMSDLFDKAIDMLINYDLIDGDPDEYYLTENGYDFIEALGWKKTKSWNDHDGARFTHPDVFYPKGHPRAGQLRRGYYTSEWNGNPITKEQIFGKDNIPSPKSVQQLKEQKKWELMLKNNYKYC